MSAHLRRWRRGGGQTGAAAQFPGEDRTEFNYAAGRGASHQQSYVSEPNLLGGSGLREMGKQRRRCTCPAEAAELKIGGRSLD